MASPPVMPAWFARRAREHRVSFRFRHRCEDPEYRPLGSCQEEGGAKVEGGMVERKPRAERDCHSCDGSNWFFLVIDDGTGLKPVEELVHLEDFQGDQWWHNFDKTNFRANAALLNKARFQRLRSARAAEERDDAREREAIMRHSERPLKYREGKKIIFDSATGRAVGDVSP